MNIKDIIEATSQLQREIKRLQLNATCPHCKKDVLGSLIAHAHDWGGYGQPSTTLFQCPCCGKEIEFKLEWETTLCWAKPVEELES